MFDPIIDIFKQPLMKIQMKSYKTVKLPWDGKDSSYHVIFEEFKVQPDTKIYIDIFPDSYASIVFRVDNIEQQVDAHYFGKMLKTNRIAFYPNCTYFTIRIPPCCLFNNTKSEPKFFINRTVPLYEWTSAFEQFHPLKLLKLNFREKITYFQNHVRSNFPYHTNKIVSYVLKNGSKNNQMTIKLLANKLNVSDRYIRQIFHTNVGVSPKQLIQAVRLQKALASIEESNRLVDVFIAMDFYDQAHLSKFIKDATLYLPSDLKKLIQYYEKRDSYK